jgi:hypothetical protein
VDDHNLPPDHDWDIDDEELDSWAAEWAEVDRQALEVLRDAWPSLREAEAPPAGLRYVAEWLEALAETISPTDVPETDSEEEAAVWAMQHADWLAFVLGLVRRGVGAELTAETALHDLETMDEIDGDPVDVDDVLPSFGLAVEVLAPRWQSLGVLDDDRGLTELGLWGLPRALEMVWADQDDQPPELERLDAELEEAALAILARTPVTLEHLRRELAREARVVEARELELGLLATGLVHDFQDGRLGYLPALAEGVVLTHQLTAAELEIGALDAGLDLNAWSILADEGVALVGGGELRERYAISQVPMPGESGSAYFGPDGWLSAFVDGELIGLRYVGGQIAVEKVASIDEVEEHELTALADSLAAAVEYDERHGDPVYPGASAAEVVFDLLAGQPGALRRPWPCLSDLARELGYDVHGGYVGRSGTRWYGEPSWFDEPQVLTWRVWESAKSTLRRTGRVPDDVDWRELAIALGTPLLDEAGLDLVHEPALEPLAETMLHAVTGPALAVPLYLRAKAAEGRGDARAWLDHLEQAVAADPDCRDALLDLGDLRSVMGDAREAHRLYLRAGLDTTMDDVAILAEFLHPPAQATGRNQPCPCGSGKKYKVCHGRTDLHPLPARATWLWRKVASFGQLPSNRDELLIWGGLLAGCDPSEREAVERSVSDPTTHDFAIFDGGIIDEFLRVLGPLLPDDELELVRRWRDAPRRLLEVTGIQAMRGVTATDLVTGEELVIRDRLLSRHIAVDDLLLARPLDDGSGELRLQGGPLGIPRLMRSGLLAALRADAPADEIAAMLAPRRPELRTTDGQEFVECEARYELADAETAVAAWAAALEGDPDGPWHLLDKNDVVLGSISRQGSRAVVRSNAVERFRALQSLLLAADPDARLLDESMQPFSSYDASDAPASEAPASGPPAEPPVELSPADYQLIARQFEDRWLADSIPALGGLTPRQAAEERREELVALLRDLEIMQRRQPTPFDMDLGRIRRELGLT